MHSAFVDAPFNTFSTSSLSTVSFYTSASRYSAFLASSAPQKHQRALLVHTPSFASTYTKSVKMAIQEGDTLPDHTFSIVAPNGEMKDATTKDIFGGRSVAICCIPGAFTPTCSEKHLPGFIETVADFKKLGVTDVVCLSANDKFVMKSFGSASGASKAGVTMIADGAAGFASKIGLPKDTGDFGGLRFARFSALVVDGKVIKLNVDAAGLDMSAADVLLSQIRDTKEIKDPLDELCKTEPESLECLVYDT